MSDTHDQDRPAPAASEAPAAAAEETPVATAAGTPEPTLEELLAQQEARLAELQKEAAYRQAELENFKKRTEKRYRQALEYATEGLLRDLLPVLDNLERAVEHATEPTGGGIDALCEGLGHVIEQFRGVLRNHHVERVPDASERFDPEVHEAVLQVTGPEDGVVASVFEKGYRLKSRLLRPSKVAVTKVAPPEGDD